MTLMFGIQLCYLCYKIVLINYQIFYVFTIYRISLRMTKSRHVARGNVTSFLLIKRFV
jgi:hypothetical protein